MNMPILESPFFQATPQMSTAGVLFFVVGLIFLAFWIWMVAHAVKHNIANKPIWILVLWFMNIFGAIIYYFAVKKECPCCKKMENVCVCDPDGTCHCGVMNTKDLDHLKEKIEN